jgi:hypothetical protein
VTPPWRVEGAPAVHRDGDPVNSGWHASRGRLSDADWVKMGVGSRMREMRTSGSERGRGTIVAWLGRRVLGCGDSLTNTQEAGGGSLPTSPRRADPHDNHHLREALPYSPGRRNLPRKSRHFRITTGGCGCGRHSWSEDGHSACLPFGGHRALGLCPRCSTNPDLQTGHRLPTCCVGSNAH